MKRLPALALVLLVCGAQQVTPPKFTIRDYSFEWRVSQSGRARYILERSNGKTVAWLRADAGSMVVMPPATAAKVGRVFAEAVDRARRMPDGESESVTAGTATVRISNGSLGASVSVRCGSSSLSLEPQDAAALAEHLVAAVEAAAWLDERIKP